MGSQVLIECSGQGYPEPNLEWIIRDVHFPKEGTVLPTGTLRFDPVTPDDAGVYRCSLGNSIGSDHVEIMVKVKG